MITSIVPKIRLLAAIAMLGLLALQPVFAQDDAITVLAAASLKEALEEAGKVFSARNGTEIKFSFAASAIIAKQIASGAPADLFASADINWMNYLDEKNLIQSNSRVNLLGNSLVFIAPQLSNIQNMPLTQEGILEAVGNGKIAIADMNTAPIGLYAKNASQKLGIWDVIEPRLLQAKNVIGAVLAVARGDAPIGLVYFTDAKNDSSVKIVAIYPEESNVLITYSFALTKASKNPEAEKFLEFLKTPTAMEIFEKAGYRILLKAG